MRDRSYRRHQMLKIKSLAHREVAKDIEEHNSEKFHYGRRYWRPSWNVWKPLTPKQIKELFQKHSKNDCRWLRMGHKKWLRWYERDYYALKATHKNRRIIKGMIDEEIEQANHPYDETGASLISKNPFSDIFEDPYWDIWYYYGMDDDDLKELMKIISIKYYTNDLIPISSNGRAADSESAYWGSNP